MSGRSLGAETAVRPSNRINLGFIGTGRQVFHANLPGFLWHKDVQVVAVCDVDRWRAERARDQVHETYAEAKASGAYKGCAVYEDFRELLARPDIDAVMISTPDHWHAVMAVAAARAGKDVALEKPISLSLTEGRAIADAMKQHGRIFRTDTEVRSNPASRGFVRSYATAASGKCGGWRWLCRKAPTPSQGSRRRCRCRRT
jgi:predicted dehydrogenase